MVPAGREVVVTLRALLLFVLLIVIDKDLVAVLPFASVTLNPKVLVPAPEGVPEKTPVVAKLGRAIPVLQEPEHEVTAHV